MNTLAIHWNHEFAWAVFASSRSSPASASPCSSSAGAAQPHAAGVDLVQLIQQATPTAPAITDKSRDFSRFGKAANFLLLKMTLKEGGFNGLDIMELVREKDRIVNDFEMIAKEEEVEWKHFIETLQQTLDRKLKQLKEAPPSPS